MVPTSLLFLVVGLSLCNGLSVTLQLFSRILSTGKGPSIYDVHKEGKGVRLRWKPADGVERGQRHVDVHTENYSPLTSCKEVGVFRTKISSLGGMKSGSFSSINI